MAYFIGHVEGFKKNDVRGMEIHCERLSKNSINKDVDWGRVQFNYNLFANAQRMPVRVKELVDSRYNPDQKALRKDAVVLCSAMISASPEFFQGQTEEFVRAYFEACHDFLCEFYGRENCVGAYVHMDEQTPHMHWTFVPLTDDLRLCNKEVNRRSRLSQLQDEMPKYLQQRGFNVQRGIQNSTRYHVDTKDWKRAELLKEAKQRELLEMINVTPTRWVGKNLLSDESYNKLRSVAEFAVTAVGNKEEVKRKLHEQEVAIKQQREEVEKLRQRNEQQEKEIVKKQRELQQRADKLLTEEAVLQGKRDNLKQYEKVLSLQDQDLELQRMRDDLRSEQELLRKQQRELLQRNEELELKTKQLEQGEAAAYERVREAARRAVLKEAAAQGENDDEYWERAAMAALKKENPDLYEKLINHEKQKSVQENMDAAIEEMRRGKSQNKNR